ncbi:MAG: hypothetical protein RLY86_2967 [Pseudomonadota bacterium]|jgi:SAM-dependent methyltransferase
MTERGRPDGAFERARWSASGDAWNRWADTRTEVAERVSTALLDLAELRPGLRLLDLASGAGEPALGAAARIGATGLVIASDLVAPMLAGARRRAGDGPDLPIRFLLADMQAIPLASAALDRVTCRFGLMFVPDAARTAGEIARVLAPGGIAVTAVWGPLAENTLFQVLSTALDATLGPDPAAGLAPLFRFAEPDSSADLFRAAGLAAEETGLRFMVQAPADRPFWRSTLDMAFAPRLHGLTADQRARVETTIAAGFAALAGPMGTVPLSIHVRLCRGRR